MIAIDSPQFALSGSCLAGAHTRVNAVVFPMEMRPHFHCWGFRMPFHWRGLVGVSLAVREWSESYQKAQRPIQCKLSIDFLDSEI